MEEAAMSSYARAAGFVLGSGVLLWGCAESPAARVPYFADAGDDAKPGNYAPPSDETGISGYANQDAGVRMEADAGHSASGDDAGSPTLDAGPENADAGHTGETDAGHVVHARVVDGILNPGEWDDGTWQAQNVASDWGTANTLTSLNAAVDDTFLWLALRGSVENGKNALVVFIDSVPSAGVTPAEITDQTGEDELDDALSSGIAAPAFGADFAWGTLSMPVDVQGSVALTGVRGLATPANLAWIDAPLPVSGDVVHTACTQSVCEVAIPLATLGGSGDIGLFARLVNSDGEAYANQTVPADDATQPALVSKFMKISR
jgi:hypothetical protein